jgi:hypothetical protein
MSEETTTPVEETAEEKLSKIQEELEKSKQSILKEMQERGNRCILEVNEVMKKHNCGFTTNVQVVAKPF